MSQENTLVSVLTEIVLGVVVFITMKLIMTIGKKIWRKVRPTTPPVVA